MTTSLRENDREDYQKAKTFDDLIELNKKFLQNSTATSSPYTLKLEAETNPLLSGLVKMNELKFLTTSSSPSGIVVDGQRETKKRSYVIGFVHGESMAEKLERDLNMINGVIAFRTPCNGPGYDDDDSVEETSVDIGFSKIPVSFEKQSDSHEWEVSDYVTSFNWWTLLKPVVQSELYHKLAGQCYNFYIIDASEMNNEDGLLPKVVEILHKYHH